MRINCLEGQLRTFNTKTQGHGLIDLTITCESEK
uniref:Uncharacterized protein n=1 Tax=Rhizophora mucronata TaxID=61149 RepID=A0A2P2Q4G7_RHIMU